MVTRRIVTGTNSEGRSYFIHDGETPCHLDFGIVVNDEIRVSYEYFSFDKSRVLAL